MTGPPAEQRPEYEWLQQLKRSEGRELQRRHGAHALGIGWKRVGGTKTDDLALIFYVERKSTGPEPVPDEIAFTPPGADRQVLLRTDVVESAPAVFE